jgi:N-acetylglutamate synthase-like GNAT family acetyltransferase
MRTRLARPEDVPAICALIQIYAEQDLLLPRTAEQVRAGVKNFLVLTDGHATGQEELLGCVALEPYGPQLVEIRSLAVQPALQGHGLGGRLIEAALSVARRRRIARVFAVTHMPSLFERHNFVATLRQALPEKVERDCNTCPKARKCKLVALVAVVCPDPSALPVLVPAGGAAVGA